MTRGFMKLKTLLLVLCVAVASAAATWFAVRQHPASPASAPVTDAGRKVLRGEEPFQLREDALSAKPKARRASKLPPTPRDEDAELLDRLKALRAAVARAAKQPAYVIFPDRTLIEMARLKPQTLDELGDVHGVGAAKLQKYGSAFLAVVKEPASA